MICGNNEVNELNTGIKRVNNVRNDVNERRYVRRYAINERNK